MSGQTKLNRREFLRLAALGAGGAALAACAAPPPAAPAAAPTTAAKAAEPTKAAAAPAAPTAAPAAAAKGGNLRVYWNPGHHYTTYKDLATKYEADTGWKINWEIYQWPDMRTKLLANFAAGDVPDLCEEAGWVQEFGLAGHLLSWNPYIDKYGKEWGYPTDWQEAALKAFRLKDEYYGVKIHHTCTLLFYNIDLFSAAGVKPESVTTWEAFLDACKATAKGNVFGFAPNQSNGYAWPWFFQNGVTNYDPAKKVVPMDTPESYEALQFQADLIHKHKVAPIPVTSADYEGPQKLFSAKRAAMILTGPWDVKPILDSSPDVKWGMIQPLKRKVQATSGAGAGVFIPKKAKNPDASFEFIRRMTSLDVEMAATKEANMLMPRKSWAANPDVAKLERLAPFAQALSLVVDTSDLNLTGKAGAIGDLFKKAYDDTIYNNKPASETLKEYVAASNKLLAG